MRFVIAHRCGSSLDVASIADLDSKFIHNKAESTRSQLPVAISQEQSHAAALRALPELRFLLSDRPRQPTSPGLAWVRFPPKEGEPHPLLKDDLRKAEYVNGLDFGWLQVLSHFPPSYDMAVDNVSGQTTVDVGGEPSSLEAALVQIDRCLLILLRLPRLSDEVFTIM